MVLYANKSLYHLLDIKSNNGNSFNGTAIDELEFDNLKQALIQTNISPYTSKANQKGKNPLMSTVWRFILKGEKGQTFKLESPQNNVSAPPPSKMKKAIEPLMYKSQKTTNAKTSEI